MSVAETTLRKVKTAEDIRAQMAKLQAQLIAVEQSENSAKLGDLIAQHKLVEAVKSIASEAGVEHISVVTALGKALKIPRLSVTQTEKKQRAPRGSKQKEKAQKN